VDEPVSKRDSLSLFITEQRMQIRGWSAFADDDEKRAYVTE
jgi:hypothetical protein